VDSFAGKLAVVTGVRGGPRKQPRFQGHIVKFRGDGPCDAGGRRAVQVGGDRPQADRTRLRNRPVPDTGLIVKSKNVAKLAHR